MSNIHCSWPRNYRMPLSAQYAYLPEYSTCMQTKVWPQYEWHVTSFVSFTSFVSSLPTDGKMLAGRLWDSISADPAADVARPSGEDGCWTLLLLSPLLELLPELTHCYCHWHYHRGQSLTVPLQSEGTIQGLLAGFRTFDSDSKNEVPWKLSSHNNCLCFFGCEYPDVPSCQWLLWKLEVCVYADVDPSMMSWISGYVKWFPTKFK